jgi:hypothetical protein
MPLRVDRPCSGEVHARKGTDDGKEGESMISSISSSASLLSLQSTQGAKSGSRPEKPDVQEMFNSLDTNGDGKVSLEELQAASESRQGQQGPPAGGGPQGTSGPPSAEQMMTDLDSDGDGAVSFEEFSARRPPEPPQGPPPWLENATSSVLSTLFATDNDASAGGLLAATA